MIYKVSYVVVGGSHPGAIINQDTPPATGEQIELNGDRFDIVEVIELLPPRDDIAYLHATCTPAEGASRSRRNAGHPDSS